MFPDFLNERLRFMSVRILKLLGGRHIPPLFFTVAFVYEQQQLHPETESDNDMEYEDTSTQNMQTNTQMGDSSSESD